jgi:multiple sugar transport system ATP-binding protein
VTQIRFQGIEKRFGDVVVVDNLDLTIEDKEFFTFVGPSGCGKSTILNMIAGLEDVSSGTIYFDNTPVNGLSPGQRDVSMVFQSYALYPHMSIYENIAFPLRVRKESEKIIDTKIKQLVSLLGLESLLHRKPRELSGGQRQRVALGRAIIRRPKVFLMDEPLSNLDARLRIEMRSELKKLHQNFQITTAYVTHDQEEAMVLSDRIAVIYDGKVQQLGRPIEVYTKPSNLFVAKFIGNPPINLIDGSSVKDVPSFKHFYTRLENADFIFGVRPSDIFVSAKDVIGAMVGEVVLTEQTGSDIWVDVLWQGIKIRGRAHVEENIVEGKKVFLNIPVVKIHVFYKSSELRIDF